MAIHLRLLLWTVYSQCYMSYSPFLTGVHLVLEPNSKDSNLSFCHKFCIFPTLASAFWFCLLKFLVVFNFRNVAFLSSQISWVLFFAILIEISNSPMLVWGHIRDDLQELANDLLVIVSKGSQLSLPNLHGLQRCCPAVAKWKDCVVEIPQGRLRVRTSGCYPMFAAHLLHALRQIPWSLWASYISPTKWEVERSSQKT